MALVDGHSRTHLTTWDDAEPDHLINVFLKMWDGQTLCCAVDTKQAAICHIESLRDKVLESYPGESLQNFFFVAQSKPVNDRTCDSLVWRNGTTVFVEYRNKGGCFIFSFSILCIIFMAIIGSFCTCGTSLLIVPVLFPFLFVLPLFCL